MISRDRVYAHEALKDPLISEMIARDLIPVPFAVGDYDAAIADGASRAIVEAVDRPMTSVAERKRLHVFLTGVAPRLLSRGCLVCIVVIGDDPAGDHYSFVCEQVSKLIPDLGIADYSRLKPKVVRLAEAGAQLAQHCARHRAGRPHRTVAIHPLMIGHQGVPAISKFFERAPEDELLLQRAFCDCDEIQVTLLQSTGQGAGVRRVYAVHPRKVGKPEIVPFIAKSGSHEAINLELGNTQNACGERTPFFNMAPLAMDRHVDGQMRSLLVSHFIERAILFSDYIKTHTPAVVVASLFDGPLRCWRSDARQELIAIGKYAAQCGLLRTIPKLYEEAHAKAEAQSGQKLPEPRELLKLVRKLPKRPIFVCMSHGDLHAGNVFVRENSVDMVLIDFARAGIAPASRDPAEFEVSLAFEVLGSGAAPLDNVETEALYSGALLGRRPIPRSSKPRCLAIEQIRRQVHGIVAELEYREMVAIHCLWYARRGSASAYRAACGLLAQ